MKRILIAIAFALVWFTSSAQVYERMVTARDTLKTKGTFVYQGTRVPVADLSYIQWSSTGVGTPVSSPANWHKTWVMGDVYLSTSSDFGVTWSNAIPQGAEQDPIVKAIVGYVYSNGTTISAASNSTALAAVSGTNTGDQDLTGLVHSNRTALDAVSGVNTGDQDLTGLVHSNRSALDLVSGTNTGDQDLTGLVHSNRSALDLVSGTNTGDQDISGKVDKVAGKVLSDNNYTDADSTKVAHLSGTNTGDQDLTGLVHSNRSALDLVSGTNTGDQDLTGLVHSNRTALDAVSGTNTGDETQSTIKTKLGAASTSTDGYLTSTDWSTFNGKQASLGYTAENAANKVTSISASSTDVQYPSAKVTWDNLKTKQNINTGYISGLALSINSDPTKFDIASGTYVVTNYADLNNPKVKLITYAGSTGNTPAYLTTANATYVALDSLGAVQYSSSPFTNTQRRSLCVIGATIHSNRSTINVTNEIKATMVATTSQLHDFIRAIGPLNLSGNVYGPNGANLSLDKSSGTIFGLGINTANFADPHSLTIGSQTALSFRYRLRGGTEYADQTSIDPAYYDLNGSKTAVNNNKFTVQRINLFQSGLTRIQYGQHEYNTLADANAALPTEVFVTETNIADNAVFRCYLIIKQGTTDLTAAVAAGNAKFVPVDKFGNALGSGGGAVTSTAIITALGYTPMMDVAPGTSGNVLTSNGSTWVSGTPTSGIPYPPSGIPLSTGSAWGTSITNNSANWNTAYSWGNHASAGYQAALGYTPENVVNKENTTLDNSSTKYPTNNLVQTTTRILPYDTGVFGFLNLTETAISFDETTKIFTLAKVGSEWSYYRSGIKYTLSVNKTITLTTVENPLIDGRKYYIFIDATDGTLSASIAPWTLQDTKVLVAIVTWNNTLTPKYLLQEERHSCTLTRRMHLYLHNSRGTQYITGGELTGATAATNTDAANTFAIAASTIADEDLYQTLSSVADGNGTDASNYLITYRSGIGNWVWVRSDMPFSYTTSGYINWDNAGTLTQGTGGTGGSIRYYNTYLVFTNTQGEGRYIIVAGQNAYTTTTSAYAESISNFDLTGFPKTEWVAVYQCTWATGVSGLTNKGKVQLTRLPQRVTVSAITASSVTNTAHNGLLGLQGGTTNEYYHLTDAQYTVATQAATTSLNGYLSSTDWTTFNGKMDNVTPSTSGNVLTSNGSAWVSSAPSSSGVTGSGTIGYVPKFTSTTAVGNSGIFQSGSNIIIGTETDNGGKLQVYDATSAVVRAVSGTRQIFFSAMSGDWNYNQSIGAPYLLGTTDAYAVNIRTSNTERLDISSGGNFNFNSAQMYLEQSTGNLGVGTSAPGARIESKGSIVGAFPALKLWNANGTNNNVTSIDFSGSSAGTVGGSIKHYRIGSTAYDMGFSVYTGGVLTEQLRVVNTGQIKFPSYTSSTSFTGTAAANLAVDSSGNVITVAAGGGGTTWTVSSISGNTTAVANYVYVITATLTLTLPASPSTGDAIKIVDLSGSGTVVLGRNSLKIMGLSEDLTLDKANAGFELIYSGATNGWVIL